MVFYAKNREKNAVLIKKPDTPICNSVFIKNANFFWK